MTNAQISEVAEQIAKMVERGWCQGTGSRLNDNGGIEVCLSFAITTACYRVGNQDLWNLQDLQKGVWQVFTNRTDGDVIMWNDTDGRTQQQVIDLSLEISKDYRILADAEGLS